MSDSKTKNKSAALTRRNFTWMALGALGVAAAPAALTTTARAEHHESEETKPPTVVDEIEANAMLLSQVKYVSVSELEGKQCANCALLLESNGEYGRCGLFQQGKVPVTAWCSSWIKKPGV